MEEGSRVPSGSITFPFGVVVRAYLLARTDAREAESVGEPGARTQRNRTGATCSGRRTRSFLRTDSALRAAAIRSGICHSAERVRCRRRGAGSGVESLQAHPPISLRGKVQHLADS